MECVLVGHTSGGDFQIRIVLSLREGGREGGRGGREGEEGRTEGGRKGKERKRIHIEELTYFWLTSVGLKRSSF